MESSLRRQGCRDEYNSPWPVGLLVWQRRHTQRLIISENQAAGFSQSVVTPYSEWAQTPQSIRILGGHPLERDQENRLWCCQGLLRSTLPGTSNPTSKGRERRKKPAGSWKPRLWLWGSAYPTACGCSFAHRQDRCRLTWPNSSYFPHLSPMHDILLSGAKPDANVSRGVRKVLLLSAQIPSLVLQHLAVEVQIPSLSTQGPLGSSPTSPFLLTSPCTLGLSSNKKGDYALNVSTSMSLFLLFVHHPSKTNSYPSFQAQPECCLHQRPRHKWLLFPWTLQMTHISMAAAIIPCLPSRPSVLTLHLP